MLLGTSGRDAARHGRDGGKHVFFVLTIAPRDGYKNALLNQMTVNEFPVPTGEEAQGAPGEQAEDVSVESLPEVVPEPKVDKEDDRRPNVLPKRKAKLQKEKEESKKSGKYPHD